jgi:nucleoside-diphosphate-sugar epimerase
VQGVTPCPPEALLIAITGGTGFVGSRVLDLATTPVKALARKPQAARDGVTWVKGDLADEAALAQLCEGADAVIHIAGVVNAPTRAAFDVGNVAGTAAMLAAAKAAGVKRFVHVSSLAAREPGLSMYGGSKAAAEALVEASGLDWVIVRPPGVYGPADLEMLDIYKLAQRGFAVVPPGRISLIHVDDLARALLALAGGGPSRAVCEIDDGAARGYSHREFAAAIGAALGKRLSYIPLPVSMLRLGAAVGVSAKLTRDRAAYIAHPDWVSRGGNAAIAGLWAPKCDLAAGIADTIAGYKSRDWL